MSALPQINAVSKLNDTAQLISKRPIYKESWRGGELHAPEFVYEVCVGNQAARGKKGTTKQQAKHNAALEWFKHFGASAAAAVAAAAAPRPPPPTNEGWAAVPAAVMAPPRSPMLPPAPRPAPPSLPPPVELPAGKTPLALLNELCQMRQRPSPSYTVHVVALTPPLFTCTVVVDEVEATGAPAARQQLARQNAAMAWLQLQVPNQLLSMKCASSAIVLGHDLAELLLNPPGEAPCLFGGGEIPKSPRVGRAGSGASGSSGGGGGIGGPVSAIGSPAPVGSHSGGSGAAWGGGIGTGDTGALGSGGDGSGGAAQPPSPAGMILPPATALSGSRGLGPLHFGLQPAQYSAMSSGSPWGGTFGPFSPGAATTNAGQSWPVGRGDSGAGSSGSLFARGAAWGNEERFGSGAVGARVQDGTAAVDGGVVGNGGGNAGDRSGGAGANSGSGGGRREGGEAIGALVNTGNVVGAATGGGGTRGSSDGNDFGAGARSGGGVGGAVTDADAVAAGNVSCAHTHPSAAGNPGKEGGVCAEDSALKRIVMKLGDLMAATGGEPPKYSTIPVMGPYHCVQFYQGTVTALGISVTGRGQTAEMAAAAAAREWLSRNAKMADAKASAVSLVAAAAKEG